MDEFPSKRIYAVDVVDFAQGADEEGSFFLGLGFLLFFLLGDMVVFLFFPLKIFAT